MSRSTRSWWRVSALFLATALVFSACGSDDDGGDNAGDDTGGEKTTYALAFVGAKTGGDKNLGLNVLYGAQLAVQEFNESSDDIEIELKEFDTQGDPNQAPGQFEKYNADESILGIIGPSFSGETEAVLPGMQQAQLPMISASATRVSLAQIVGSEKAAKTPEGYSVFHRALPDDAAQAAGIAKFLAAKHAGKSIFFADDNQAYSTGLVQELQAATKGKHADKGHYGFPNKDDTNMDPAVTAVQGAKPDVVFYGGYYPLAGRFKKALADNEATKDIVFVSGDGALDVGFLDSAGANANGAVLACPCNFATESAPGKLGQFAKDYKAEFGQDPGVYSSEAYDAVNIFIQGIEAGNTTRAKLLAYLEGLTSYEGISKTVEWEENGNLKTKTVYLFEVKGGKLVPLANTEEL